MTIHSRSAWGARAPKSVSTNIKPVGVALHWTGPRMGPFSHSECATKVRNIQRYHQVDRGWADIAYSLMVCPHGDVYVARGKGVRTAANGTNAANGSHYAICYLGGDGDGFTEAGKSGIREGLAYLGFAPKTATTHRKVRGGGTACPGTEITRWVDAGCPVEGSTSPSTALTVTPDGDRWLGLYEPPLTGQDVKNVQNALSVALVFDPADMDGIYGRQTAEAVRSFQLNEGISERGCGTLTWAALRKVVHG